MKIVADENIPLLSEFFSDFGELSVKPGRSIAREDLVTADALIVRSVTQVDASLLEGTSIQFVGSCTIGCDHIDLDYLEANKIKFASAPGCNANSVVEYVFSCLSVLTETHGLNLDMATIGIVGFGNIGSLLGKRLGKLGVRYKAYDPYLDVETYPELCSLEEVLNCDVLTLHVPLTQSGDYPTYKMFSSDILSRLTESQFLINTSRGSIIDEQALVSRLEQQEAPTVILDVWDKEPEINVNLAYKVFMGTPHIAGYSMDGKAKGTEMIYRALCEFVGLPARRKSEQLIEEAPLSKMAFTSNAEPDWCLHTAIRACFDVRHDAGQLRQTLDLEPERRAEAFDSIRKKYRCRREFSATRIQLKKLASDLHSQFKALGFNLKQ